MAMQHKLTYGLNRSPILAARQKIPMTLVDIDVSWAGGFTEEVILHGTTKRSRETKKSTYPSLCLSISAGKT